MRKGMVVFLLIMLLLVGTAAALAGCGKSADDEAQATYNEDVEQLKTAVAGLAESSSYESFDSFKAAWSKVESAYDELATSAQAAGEKITDLTDAFTNLKEAITNITSDESLEGKVNAIKAAVEDLRNAIKSISPTGTVSGT